MSTVWYYADRRREQHGPMDAEALRAAVAAGALDDTCLVWREGLEQWQPLRGLRAELGLPPAAAPMPPPPPATSAPPASAAAYGAPTGAPAPAAGNNRGCLIAAIVVGSLFAAIVVLGILAAIAIPAYQDYLGRSKLAAVLAGADPAKAAMVEFQANTDRCPRDLEELGLAPDALAGVDELVAGAFEDGRCALELHLGPVEGLPNVAGKRVWLALEDDGSWSCSGDEAIHRQLPQACR